VGGFQSAVDDAGQVGADGVEVPMLSGSAANPRVSTSQIEELVLTAEMPSTPQTAAPLASHFNCWRRSPLDRRQLRAWRVTAASQSAAETRPVRDHDGRDRSGRIAAKRT